MVAYSYIIALEREKGEEGMFWKELDSCRALAKNETAEPTSFLRGP